MQYYVCVHVRVHAWSSMYRALYNVSGIYLNVMIKEDHED